MSMNEEENMEEMTMNVTERLPDLDEPCGKHHTYRDLVECGETWEAFTPDNSPRELRSYNALQELAEREEYLLSITENGYGKLSSAYEYRITNRGGSGVTNITITPKNGRVVQSLKVNLDDNIALISDSGKLLRCNVGENIRVVGRVSQGVSVFKVDSKEKIVSVARLED